LAGGRRPQGAAALRALPVRAVARAAIDPPDRRSPVGGVGVLMATRRQSDRSNQRAASVEQLLAAKEIVISCGSGGVGKTTTAAAMAAMAAVQHGGKVLVLTVDPAKRLANALGLEGFGNVETKVPDSAFK